jgi:hypothetical protein
MTTIGDIIIEAVVRADALQEAHTTAGGTVFVWRPNAAEQIEAAIQPWIEIRDAARKAALAELAYVTLQRDALLEITWLDLPADPCESTSRWRELFAQGWERRSVLQELVDEVNQKAGAISKLAQENQLLKNELRLLSAEAWNRLFPAGGGGAEHGERNGAQQSGPSSPNHRICED